MLSEEFKNLKNLTIDDIINEDNRLKFDSYGGNPPRASEENLELTRKYIEAIKKNPDITSEELEAIK